MGRAISRFLITIKHFRLKSGRKGAIMGLFGDKDAIVGAALGAGGAFDKNKKIDKGAVYGAALGASIGSGKEWTMEDSLKLGAVIASMDDND